MELENLSEIENNSFSFFGPIEMAFYEDGENFDETITFKITMSCLWVLLMVLSVIGNVCTCAVIIRDRTMRTPTNCYLFNLAITDLMTSLYVPIEIYVLWIPDYYPFGEEGCRIHFVLGDFLSNCSVLTISAFTVERYLVVKKPFLRQKLASKSRVFKIIATIWAVSCIFCIPDGFYIDLLEKKKYSYCYYTISEEIEIMLIMEMFVFFVFPMTVITVLYLMIVMHLKSVQTKMRSSPASGNQSRDKAAIMLAVVAATFFFCWTPFTVYRVMMTSRTYRNDEYFPVWRILNYLSAINVYLSTAINPILYSLMSRKFRQAFKDLMKGSGKSSSIHTSSGGNTLPSIIHSNTGNLYIGFKLKTLRPPNS